MTAQDYPRLKQHRPLPVDCVQFMRPHFRRYREVKDFFPLDLDAQTVEDHYYCPFQTDPVLVKMLVSSCVQPDEAEPKITKPTTQPQRLSRDEQHWTDRFALFGVTLAEAVKLWENPMDYKTLLWRWLKNTDEAHLLFHINFFDRTVRDWMLYKADGDERVAKKKLNTRVLPPPRLLSKAERTEGKIKRAAEKEQLLALTVRVKAVGGKVSRGYVRWHYFGEWVFNYGGNDLITVNADSKNEALIQGWEYFLAVKIKC